MDKQKKVLENSLEVLEDVGCQFYLCPGSDQPPRAMQTCFVCRQIREIKHYLKTGNILVEIDIWEEDKDPYRIETSNVVESIFSLDITPLK